jgi:prophage antirepressor-like protein
MDQLADHPSGFVSVAFEGHGIRVCTDHRGDAWFVAADVCAALALRQDRTLAVLAEDECSIHSREGPGTVPITLTLVSEAGLLRILRFGDRPKARRLRRWITHQVLPCLHRRNDASTPSAKNLQTSRPTKIVVALLHIAEAMARLPGVRSADAMAAALAAIEVNTGLSTTALLQVLQNCPEQASIGDGDRTANPLASGRWPDSPPHPHRCPPPTT